MAKKLTLAELIKKTKKKKEVTDIIAAAGLKIPEISEADLPIVAFSYFAAGKTQTSYYCHACKTSWNDEFQRYGGCYASYVHCPNCQSKNNRRRIVNPGGTFFTNANYAFVREFNEDDGYAIINIIGYGYTHDVSKQEEVYNDGKLEFLKKGFKPYIRLEGEFVFSTTFGIRTLDYFNSDIFEASFENINSNSYYDKIRSYESLIYIENENYKKFIGLLKNLYPEKIKEEYISRSIVNISREILCSRRKATTSRSTTAAKKIDIYAEAVFKELTPDDIVDKNDSLLSLHYETINRQDKIVHYCPSCKKSFFTSQDEGGRYNLITVTCPHCKKVYKDTRYGRDGASTAYTNKYLLFDIFEPNNELVLRYFEYKVILSYDGSIKYELSEYKRVFLTKKTKNVYEKNSAAWVKPKKNGLTITCVPSTDRWGYSTAYCVNSNEELLEIIQKTEFKYSGLLEAWGLIESPLNIEKLEEPGTVANSSYLSVFLARPYVEQIYKTGLLRATKNIISSSDVPNPYGTNVYEILNIGKPVYKMARQIDAPLSDIKLLDNFWKSDNTFDLNMYNQISELGVKNLSSRLIDIRTKYNIKYQDQMEYLRNCYNHQCIHYDSALNIWYDYLNMASKMKYRLDDAGHKYPQSLKKEHDRAQFSYKVVVDQENQRKFTEQAEKNSVLEYEGKKFIVKIPREPNEVIQEGTTLKHCVASYVENIRSGKTTVCFIRKKDEPDVSFFTSEVLGTVINQVKGYTNTLPTDEDLLEFINEWAEKKGLALGRHF